MKGIWEMKKGMFMKAKNSFLGRALRRLAGEEKGTVMMEYIVIALLIAAAAVVAVGVFGSMASGMFATLTDYMTNQKEQGDGRLDTVQGQATAGNTIANTHVSTSINQGNAAVSGVTTW